MLSEANLEAAGPNYAKVLSYVMEHSKDKVSFPAKVDKDYFKGGCGATTRNDALANAYIWLQYGHFDCNWN
jgi:hypothetical protein